MADDQPRGSWAKPYGLFALTAGGYVQCEHCMDDELRCNHVMQYLSSGDDAEMIWQHAPTWDMSAPRWQLNVPVFPSSGQYTFVYLTKTETTFPRYRVEWLDERPKKAGRPHFLAYLNPGEGRNTIRKLLVEYMLGDREFVGRECTAAHHSVVAEQEWQRKLRLQNAILADLWHVYIHGWCIHCSNNTGLDPDLIPAEEKAGVWKK